MLGFLVDVLERVPRERAQLGADACAARRPCAAAISCGGEHLPDRELLVVAPERAVADLDDVAVADRSITSGPTASSSGMPAATIRDRSAVRVATGDRLARVHDRDDARGERGSRPRRDRCRGGR